METIKLKTHVSNDGIIKLELPTALAGQDLEVLIVLQPLEETAVDELGWPLGFFERTYGALADTPLERPPDLPLETRETFQ